MNTSPLNLVLFVLRTIAVALFAASAMINLVTVLRYGAGLWPFASTVTSGALLGASVAIHFCTIGLKP